MGLMKVRSRHCQALWRFLTLQCDEHCHCLAHLLPANIRDLLSTFKFLFATGIYHLIPFLPSAPALASRT